jgi:hypothetical protein
MPAWLQAAGPRSEGDLIRSGSLHPKKGNLTAPFMTKRWNVPTKTGKRLVQNASEGDKLRSQFVGVVNSGNFDR